MRALVILFLVFSGSAFAVNYRYAKGSCEISGTEQDIFSPPKAFPKTVSFEFGATSDPKDDKAVISHQSYATTLRPEIIAGTGYVRAKTFDQNNLFYKENFLPGGQPKNLLMLLHGFMVGQTEWVAFLTYFLHIDSLEVLQDLFAALGRPVDIALLPSFEIQFQTRRTYFRFDDKNKNHKFDKGEHLEIDMTSYTDSYERSDLGVVQMHLPQNDHGGLSLHLSLKCQGGSFVTYGHK